MGQEFLETFWAWRSPVPIWLKIGLWDEVKVVYFDDSYKLGLPKF